MEPGKVFVGGIAWDTTEERLREHFRTFGEVVEAVVMRDHITGRTRGFGFVLFTNASIAEKVVREKHVIDGRTVEAKKAVPRDDYQNFSRNNGSIHGSPGPSPTKKIFVGGLASSVTETDFKKYFDQFGTITDVVVMYDPNTQRPRGFGFITYDSEKAVDKVLLKTFHELNGKMVEVKRAVPKELSPPAQTRAQSSGFKNGLNGVNSSPISYTPGYNMNSTGGRAMRMDGQLLNPINVIRSGFHPYSPSYWTGMNAHLGFSSSNGEDEVSLFGNQHFTGTYHIGNSKRYESGIGYNMDHKGSNYHSPSISNQNMWDKVNLIDSTKSVNSNAYANLGSSNAGTIGHFGRTEWMQGSSPIAKLGLNGSLRSEISNVISAETKFGTTAGNGGRKGGIVGMASSHTAINNIDDVGFGSFYSGDSFYVENGPRSSSPVLDDASFFQYGLGSAGFAKANNSFGYSEGCTVAARSNKGLAA